MRRYVKYLLLSFILTIIMSLGYSVTYCADQSTVLYEIEELSMTFQIPEDIKTITRGVKQNDPLFQDGTFDYIQTMSELRENDVYLLGKNFNKSYELEVIMTNESESAEYSDYKMLSSKAQEELLKSISSNENIVACSIYNTDSARYFESLSKNYVEGKACFSKEYYTLVNGKNILIRINSFDDQLTEEETAELKSIVDSIVFENSTKWSFNSSLIGTTVCVILLVLGFAAIATIKIRDVPVSQNLHKMLMNLKSKIKTPDNKEDESENQMIMDFLSTEKELENREIKEPITENQKQTENSENTELKGNDSIDISVEGVSVEIQDDEEIDLISDTDFEFVDEESEKNEKKTVTNSKDEFVAPQSQIQKSANDLTNEKADTNSVSNKNADNESKKSEIDNPDVTFDENNITQQSNEDFTEIDLAAAIANFEDDSERRRLRREEFRNKNKENNKGSLWSRTKK